MEQLDTPTKTTGIRAQLEPEVLWARRAFPKAQELLAGVALRTIGRQSIGWHESITHPERGAFAVVRKDGPLLDLLGEILIVTADRRKVYVYCVNSADVPADLSLSRRAFLALGRLSLDRVVATVEVRL